MRTGADRICSVLEGLGVRTVFGLPGTQNVPLFEGLRTSGLRTVLATNELAAAFMAGGYYRGSGRMAALFTIPGPGFTYGLTGLAEARHDSAALIQVTVTPAESPGQRFQLQALDQAAIAASVVKGCFRIDRSEMIDSILLEAVATAQSGEPGPVLVEVSPKVLVAETSNAQYAAELQRPTHPPEGQLSQLAARLAASRHPLFLAGQGAAAAADRLKALAERYRAPVFTTLSGRGLLPDDHPLALAPDLGLSADVANAMITEADLVLAFGIKFSHNGTGGFELRIDPAKLVHVDASSEVLEANYPASLAIQADVPTLLDSLLTMPPPAGRTPDTGWNLAPWRPRLAALRGEGGAEPAVFGSSGWRAPSAFLGALRAALPREAILVTDSGRHQALARRYFPVLSPRGFLAPSDFQSMGFGLPAAIGAAVANPDRPVVALIGDGGLAMAGLELVTAVRERLNLTVVVFNDGQLGLIREQQLRDYGHTHGVALGGLNVASLATATGADFLPYGGNGTPALGTVVGNGRVTVVEVLVADSAGGRAAHLKGYVRARARALVSTRLRAWLKRLVTGRELAR